MQRHRKRHIALMEVISKYSGKSIVLIMINIELLQYKKYYIEREKTYCAQF